MVRVVVTGGIACGKSLVGSFLAERGVPVCDTDELAHTLMRVGESAYDAVVERFGSGILQPDGEIDRRALGRRVFGSVEERAVLDAIVHPLVIASWRDWLAEVEAAAAGSGTRRAVAAVIVPLLFEVGQGDGWDAVLCVASSRQIQMERLRARGFSDVEASQRINAQMPTEEKVKKADYVLINNGDVAALEKQTARVLAGILERERHA